MEIIETVFTAAKILGLFFAFGLCAGFGFWQSIFLFGLTRKDKED